MPGWIGCCSRKLCRGAVLQLSLPPAPTLRCSAGCRATAFPPAGIWLRGPPLAEGSSAGELPCSSQREGRWAPSVGSIHCLPPCLWPGEHRALLQRPRGWGTTARGRRGTYRGGKGARRGKGAAAGVKEARSPLSGGAAGRRPGWKRGSGSARPWLTSAVGTRAAQRPALHRPSQQAGVPAGAECEQCPQQSAEMEVAPQTSGGFLGGKEDAENAPG